MSVDVSKAAVDARIAKRDRKLSEAQRAEGRVIMAGLLAGAASLVGMRLWTGEWLPLFLAGIVFGLAFAAGQAIARATAKRPAP